MSGAAKYGSESPQLFNELYYMKSVAKQEYRKGNYELAERYFEKSLDLPDGETSTTRLLLSICQQHTFKPHLAAKNNLKAVSMNPMALSVIENSAKLLIDNAEFGKSWLKYDEGAKIMKYPNVLTLGKLTAANIMDKMTVISKSKYRYGCLGNALLSMARQGDVREMIRANHGFSKDDRVHRKRELFYLQHVAQDKKFYEQLLESTRVSGPLNESDARFVDQMRHVVDASDQVLVSLYSRKPWFLHRCETNELRGARLKNKINRLELIKNTRRVQIMKYMDVIHELIMNDKIVEARHKTELLIDYKNKISYKPKKLFHRIFQSFGIIQYLKFQNLDGWNEEENHQRKLSLLGATECTLRLRESLFGTNYPNPRVTKNKLRARIQKSKCSMEKMFLHFEIAKCHLQMSIDNLKKAQVHVIDCYKLAYAMNCHTYIVNSTILMGSIEFAIGFKKKTSQAFNVALKYAQSIKEPGIIEFMEKLIDMTNVIKPLVITHEDRMEKEILNFVSKKMKEQTKYLLKRINENTKEIKSATDTNESTASKS